MREFFDDFKNYKVKIEGKNAKSMEQYIYRMQSFLEFNKIETLDDLLNLNSSNVKKWLSFLSDTNNSERSRNIKLTAVKEIYKYIKYELKKEIDDDILRIPFAKVPKKEREYLDYQTAIDLISFIKNMELKVALAIILTTGVRYSELIQITCDDIEKGECKVVGKGNKERPIYFPMWVQEIAKQFMNGKRLKNVKKYGKQKEEILLVNNCGNVIDRRRLERSMKRWANKFNETYPYNGKLEWWEHFSPHTLRHTFATEQLRLGHDVATVRDELGHSNIATTNNYSHSNKERVKEAMLGIDKEKSSYIETLLKDDDMFKKFKKFLEEENNGN